MLSRLFPVLLFVLGIMVLLRAYYLRGCCHSGLVKIGLAYCEHCGFYRAMHNSAKRGLAIAYRLSDCLSVCLSVCL